MSCTAYGGFFGSISTYSFPLTISNCYSLASFSPLSNMTAGGFGGDIQVIASGNVNISCCYCFLSLLNVTSAGSFLGSVTTTGAGSLTFSNVYVSNQTSPFLPPIASGRSTDGSSVLTLSCGALYSNILSHYNQTNVWGGDRLRSEYGYSFGYCNCTTGCPTPATQYDTTQLFPTSHIATTQTVTSTNPLTYSPITNQPTSRISITSLPTSISFTTLDPSSLIPSSLHTTLTPNTQIPSKQPLLTQISSTQLPATQMVTSISPTLSSPTISPSVFISSTQTLSPQISTPQIYTLIQTAVQSSAVHPSSTSQSPTILQQTNVVTFSTLVSSLCATSPPTTFQSNCPYQVANCHKCPIQAPVFDLTQGSVFCIFFQNEWTWTFTLKNGTFTNNGDIVVSGNMTILIEGNINNNASVNITSGSTVFVEGNLTQSSGGQIVFTFNSQQNNNKSVPLNVGGCVSINGNISLNLETQPQQGTTNLQVISYNCSQQFNISSSQIQVVPNYNGSNCDTINSQTINQPNSLGVSLTSTLGNKCNGGKNLGLIIGLAVGIPVAVITLTGVILAIRVTKRNKKLNSAIKQLQEQMRVQMN